jgi:hypothetical protein
LALLSFFTGITAVTLPYSKKENPVTAAVMAVKGQKSGHPGVVLRPAATEGTVLKIEGARTNCWKTRKIAAGTENFPIPGAPVPWGSGNSHLWSVGKKIP